MQGGQPSSFNEACKAENDLQKVQEMSAFWVMRNCLQKSSVTT